MESKKSINISLLVSVIMGITGGVAKAHPGHGDSAPDATYPTKYMDTVLDDIRNVYTELGSSGNHASMTTDVDHEYIDTFAGILQHKYVDIAVPANGGLDLVAARNYQGIQPHQFKRMTAMQRSVNGLGWHTHFGKLVSSSLNSENLCDEPGNASTASPIAEFNSLVAAMLADLEDNSYGEFEAVQARITAMKSLLSRRATFALSDLTELETLAVQAVHDIAQALEGRSDNAPLYDLSDLIPDNDTSPLALVTFFKDVVSGFSMPFNTRDNIAFEMPDGSRRMLFRDGIQDDGSLMSRERLKLRCEAGQMLVVMPNGTRYRMTEYERFIGQRQPSEYSDSLYWGENSWYVSSIEDLHNNRIDISYGENDFGIKYITQVSSSDQNALPINYNYENTDSELVRLESIESGGRRWEYAYETATLAAQQTGDADKQFNLLTSVTRPDGRVTQYSYSPTTFQLTKYTSAFGAVVDYTYQDIDILADYASVEPSYRLYSALDTKTVSGPDIDTVNWSYHFDLNSQSSATSEVLKFDKSTIVGPYASTDYYHYTGHPYQNGVSTYETWFAAVQSLSLVSDSVARADSSRISARNFHSTVKVSNHYGTNGVPLLDYVSHSAGEISTDTAAESGVYLPVVISRSLHDSLPEGPVNSAGPVSLLTRYQNFDELGFPKLITEVASGYVTDSENHRTREITYSHNPQNWVIGLPKTQKITQGAEELLIDRTYTAEGRLALADVTGVNTSYAYHDNGEISSITDANDHVTTFGAYKNGRATSVTNAEGEATLTSVNPTGTIASVTDPRGHVTAYVYDTLDRPIKVTPAINTPVTIDYATESFMQTTTRGNLTTEMTYDVLGRAISAMTEDTASAGGEIVSSYVYDLANRRTFSSLPNSELGSSTQYNGINQLVSQTDSAGHTTSYDYEASFRGVTVTNKRGYKRSTGYKHYGFDSQLGQITEPYDDDQRITVIDHNVVGDRTKISQSSGESKKGLVREFAYDSRYFLTETTEPEIGVTTYTTDSVGNVISSEIENVGRKTAYEYDKANRLILTDYPGRTEDITYSYNQNGQLASTQTGRITNQYNYNENNQLADESIIITGRFSRNHQLSYDYDSLDNLASITYPNGFSVDYNPDALGRPTKVGTLASDVEFTDDGQLSRLLLVSGKTLSYGYDQRLMPSSITTPGLMGLSYNYDPQGNVSMIANTADVTHNVSFGNEAYDGLDRLQNAITSSQSVGQINHQYDALGNLTSLESLIGGTQDTTTYHTGSNLRYIRNTASSKPDINLNYDSYGHVVDKKKYEKTSDGLTANVVNNKFVYDDASRLLTVNVANPVAQTNIEQRNYHYDGQKYRVISEVPGSYDVNYSFYSLSGDLMFEESVETCSTFSNVRLGSMLLARHDAIRHETTFDTDGDTLNDCLEFVFGLNPQLSSDAQDDNDNDGLTNAQEILEHATLIDNDDSDEDGVSDADEVAAGTNPNKSDTDGDTIADGDEAAYGTDPVLFDTDHDGMSDGVEVSAQLDPLDATDGVLDLDQDSFSNRQEALLGFDPSSNASTPPSQGRKEWDFDGLGLVLSAPSIDSNQRIYYGTDQGYVYAVYPDGSLRWSFKITGSVYGSIAVDEANQSLTFGGSDGFVYALDFQGQLKWKVDLADPILGSPAFDAQGTVFIASKTKVWSITTNGNVVWQYELNGETDMRSRVAISADNKVYIGDSSERLYSINGETGDLIYSRTVSGSIAQAAPAIARNGSVFVMTSEGRLHYIDPNGSGVDSLQLQDLDHTPNVYSSPVIASDDTLYLGVSDVSTLPFFPFATRATHELTAVRFEQQDMFVTWRYNVSGEPTSPAIGSNGTVFIADSTGLIHAVGPEGDAKWVNDDYSDNVVGSVSIDVDGTLYLSYQNGTLSAIANTEQSEQDQWSGLGHGAVMSGNQCQRGSVVYGLINDQDSDGFPDCYELLNGLDMQNAADGNRDSDNDGLTDGQEYRANTDPNNPDTDGDGIFDGEEINNGTNPLDRQPQLTITSPTGAVDTVAGATVLFRATAYDGEDGPLTAVIEWSSNLDGLLGIGGAVDVSTLSVGQHIVTVSVSDSAGSTQAENISVLINVNQAPNVEITSPSEGSSFELGDEVNFEVVAIDPEDGDISADVKWVSSIDGAIGMGALLSNSELAIGSHIISANLSDSVGLAATASVTIEVNYDPLADPDNDGLDTQTELDLGTDPIQNDTDHDGLHDGLEVTLETSPLFDLGEAVADYDGDGFSNRQESATDTDVLDPAIKPELGALMWRTPSYGELALSDDNVLHSGGSVIYQDGTLKERLNFGESAEGRPVLGVSGVKYTSSESSIYKTDVDGIVTTLAEFDDSLSGGFYGFGAPSVNDDESLLLVTTGAAYVDSEALSVNAQGQLVAKYYNPDGRGYDWSGKGVLGPNNRVYLTPAEADALHVYNENGDLDRVDSLGFSSDPSIIIDQEEAAYIKLGGFRSGLVMKISPDPTSNWAFQTNVQYYDGSMLIGYDHRLYTKYLNAQGNSILANINTNTGAFEELSCGLSDLGFIGKNGRVYVTESSQLTANQTILKACDPLTGEVWRSGVGQLNSGFASAFVVASDGTLLISDYSNISAYVTDSNGLANSAWPIRRRDNRKSNHQSGILPFNGAEITSPLSGKRLGGNEFTLRWGDTSAQSYRLRVGEQPKGGDFLDVVLAADVTEQSVDIGAYSGPAVYVTLESFMDGRETFIETAAYQTQPSDDTPTAQLTSHSDGAVLSSSGPKFTWNSVSGAERYRFWFGSTPGAKDIKAAWAGSMKTDKIIRGLPLDGSTVYLRFATRKDGEWTHNDYEFTAHTDTGPLFARLTSPENGDVVDTPHVTFTWLPIEDAQRHRFWFGSTPGAKDIKVARAGANKTSKKVLDLPLDGSTVYVRFFTKKYNEWRYQDHQFTAHTDLTPQVSQLTSPVADSTLASPHIRFKWQDIGADKYRISIGSAPGARDIRRVRTNGDKTEKLVKSLPHDGRPIYVQLSSKKYGRWKSNDYVSTTHTDPVPDTSELTSHTNADTLTGDRVTFEWTDVEADRHRLLVGTTKNGKDIKVKTFRNPVTHQYEVTGLPTDGSTVYVKLVTYKYGVWTNRQYEFTTTTD